MLCKKCGAHIEDDAKECAFCGEKFLAVEPEPVAQEEVVAETITEERSTHEIFEENEKKRREQIEKNADERKQQLSEINERRELKKKKERRNKIILIVVLCLIVVVLAAGGAIYLRAKDGGNDIVTTTPSPTPTATVTPTPTVSPLVSAEPTSTPTAVTAQPTATAQSGGVSGPVKVTTTKTPVSAVQSTPAPTKAAATPAPAKDGGSRKGTGSKSYATPSKLSGVVDGEIVSELVVGGEVIDDNTTKNPVMTFSMNGTTYYAYVSKGSWTEAINGKYMTISAVPTAELYKGNTIYDISKLVYYTADDYVIADSGVRLLTEEELQKYSKNQLALARNEIYARHGRTFKLKEFADYFTGKSWYKISDKYDYENESANINEIESKNVNLILKVELSK